MTPSSGPPAIMLLSGGAFVFALLLMQVAIGKRWIKLKGRTHWNVHRWVAYVIVFMGAVHALGALTYFEVIPGIGR